MSSRDERTDFRCLRCGRCCRLDGYVRVRPEEIERIARYLKISTVEVRRRYVSTTSWGNGKVDILRDHPGSTDCIFLESGNECVIHPVKPEQCRTFPIKWKRAGADLYCAALRAMREEGD